MRLYNLAILLQNSSKLYQEHVQPSCEHQLFTWLHVEMELLWTQSSVQNCMKPSGDLIIHWTCTERSHSTVLVYLFVLLSFFTGLATTRLTHSFGFRAKHSLHGSCMNGVQCCYILSKAPNAWEELLTVPWRLIVEDEKWVKILGHSEQYRLIGRHLLVHTVSTLVHKHGKLSLVSGKISTLYAIIRPNLVLPMQNCTWHVP